MWCIHRSLQRNDDINVLNRINCSNELIYYIIIYASRRRRRSLQNISVCSNTVAAAIGEPFSFLPQAARWRARSFKVLSWRLVLRVLHAYQSDSKRVYGEPFSFLKAFAKIPSGTIPLYCVLDLTGLHGVTQYLSLVRVIRTPGTCH